MFTYPAPALFPKLTHPSFSRDLLLPAGDLEYCQPDEVTQGLMKYLYFSFLSDTQLSFGCKFSYRPLRASIPVAQVFCLKIHESKFKLSKFQFKFQSLLSLFSDRCRSHASEALCSAWLAMLLMRFELKLRIKKVKLYNKVTHCIRPADIKLRRAVIILR